MVKKYVAILAVLLLMGAVSLVYGSRALADLSAFDPAANILETKLILSPDTIIPGNQEIELIEARPIIARRLDKLGLDGPYRLVIRNDQLEVTLPQGQNIPYIASVITSVGEIVFINGGKESPPWGKQSTWVCAPIAMIPIKFSLPAAKLKKLHHLTRLPAKSFTG